MKNFLKLGLIALVLFIGSIETMAAQGTPCTPPPLSGDIVEQTCFYGAGGYLVTFTEYENPASGREVRSYDGTCVFAENMTTTKLAERLALIRASSAFEEVDCP